MEAPVSPSIWSRILLTSALLSLAAFIGVNYFLGIEDCPHPHGDEYSLLSIPYRFSHYGDLRLPAFWSSTYGSDKIRCSPGIVAFTFRNVFHTVVGFSPLLSRTFSALCFLAVVLSAPVFLRRAGLNWWQCVLMLSPIALAPVYLLCARAIRTEQEVLFSGWIGAVLIPCLVPSLPGSWAKAAAWCLAGVFIGVAGASHPMGLGYGVFGLWLIFTWRSWHAWDGLRLWQRLLFLGIGLAVIGVPTLIWLMDPDKRAFVAHIAEMQRVRDVQMVPYLASLPPWNGLAGVLPQTVVARLNIVHSAGYVEFFSYPVPAYSLSRMMIGWYYAQLFLVIGFFGYSLCRRFQNANPWVHLAVLLAIAFIIANCYLPITLYAVYSTFYVTLAAGAVLWQTGRAWKTELHPSAWRRHARIGVIGLYAVATLLYLHYGVRHVQHLTSILRRGEFPNASIDQEFTAVEEMARKLHLKDDDHVLYTFPESWIASGRNHESLWETTILGLVEPREDAAGTVFKHSYANFYLASYGADIGSTFPSRQQRVARLEKFLKGQHLCGLIFNEWDRGAGYSFYASAPPTEGRLLVARMRRTRQIEYGVAIPQEAIASPDSITLPPGSYVVSASLQGDLKDAILEVQLDGEKAEPIRFPLGSVYNVISASFVLEVNDTSQRFELRCRSKEQSLPIRHVQVYRLESTPTHLLAD